MTARSRLYMVLCEEVAQGWPDPYWPQDRDAAQLCTRGLSIAQDQALVRYVELIAEVAA